MKRNLFVLLAFVSLLSGSTVALAQEACTAQQTLKLDSGTDPDPTICTDDGTTVTVQAFWSHGSNACVIGRVQQQADHTAFGGIATCANNGCIHIVTFSSPGHHTKSYICASKTISANISGDSCTCGVGPFFFTGSTPSGFETIEDPN